MAKFAAIILLTDEKYPYLSLVTDKNNKLKLFTTELQAENYINKEYSISTIFYGLIPDPTSIHKLIRSKRDSKED